MQETRYQRIAREQAERQAARQLAMKPARKPRRAKLSRYHQGEFAHAPFGTADNLGESPDY